MHRYLSLPCVLSNTTHFPVLWQYTKPAQTNILASKITPWYATHVHAHCHCYTPEWLVLLEVLFLDDVRLVLLFDILLLVFDALLVFADEEMDDSDVTVETAAFPDEFKLSFFSFLFPKL